MQDAAPYKIPDHVPPELFVPGNIWVSLGDRPHDTLVRAIGGRAIVYLQYHPIPGHSPRGTWSIASAELAREMLLDTGTFTSAKTTSLSNLLDGDMEIVPIEADPPSHDKYRAVIADYFKPRSVNALAEKIRARCDALLDDIIDAGRCDFVEQFGKILPASIFLDIYGLPQSQTQQFLTWSNQAMGAPLPADRIVALKSIQGHLREELSKRRVEPTDDLLSAWAHGTVDGRSTTEAEALGGVMLLFTAGLDTVAALMSWIFRHLAENPEDQTYLRDDPCRINGALDEFLRYFASVTVTRRATRDTILGGVHIKRGETVICTTTLPSRDEREFAQPNDLNVQAKARRHTAFGYGVHTCIGMHLARLELKISLERWLRRVQPFYLAGDTPSHGGPVIALDGLPLRWDN